MQLPSILGAWLDQVLIGQLLAQAVCLVRMPQGPKLVASKQPQDVTLSGSWKGGEVASRADHAGYEESVDDET